MGSINDQILFDGSNSIDDDNEQLRYKWDFGDGSSGDGITIVHTYTSAGIYQVTLTVTDNENKSSQDWGLACIDEEPITLDVTGGFGLTIEISNHLDYEIKDTVLNLDITGGLQNMDSRTEHILSIASNQKYTLILPLVGVGKGTTTINYENILLTIQFLSLGPFMLII